MKYFSATKVSILIQKGLTIGANACHVSSNNRKSPSRIQTDLAPLASIDQLDIKGNMMAEWRAHGVLNNVKPNLNVNVRTM